MMTDTSQDNFSELDRFEQTGKQITLTEIINNEYEQRVWLLSSKFTDKPDFSLQDLILKELALSNIPDLESAYIYSVKMDCVEEWNNIGFPNLAKRRLAKMLIRLQILRGVGGVERFLQSGHTAASMLVTNPQMERSEYMQIPEEEMNLPRGHGMGGRLAGIGGGIVKMAKGTPGKKRWWDD